jgi:hypothetical protein
LRKDIDVLALMKKDGKVLPKQIMWEDGRKFNIDRVLDIRAAASTKGGGKGIRYLCKIANKEKYLFLDNYLWFVEV